MIMAQYRGNVKYKDRIKSAVELDYVIQTRETVQGGYFIGL